MQEANAIDEHADVQRDCPGVRACAVVIPHAVRSAALLILALSATSIVQAQPIDPHAVQPERPTVATHAGTVAPGWVEIETGAEFDRYEETLRGTTLPIVGKFGIGPTTQFSVFGSVLSPPGSGSLRVGDIAAGVKWRLADDLPVLGRFAILPSLKIPTGSSESGAGTGTVDGSLLLISSHDLGPVALDINIGFTRRSGDGSTIPRDSALWTISFGGPARGAIGWVAEVYGYPGTSGPAGQAPIVALLFGPTMSARSWLAFDAGFIAPLGGPQPKAVYLGGVWNIGRWRH